MDITYIDEPTMAAYTLCAL